jgi:transaldolase
MNVNMWDVTDAIQRLIRERVGDADSRLRGHGATSNPAIFARAISGSDGYDDPLRAAVTSGVRDPQELFLALALDDVRRAADLLRPTYNATDGRDGFVSFECTPDLADDTAATIAQAVDLWGRLDRPM